MIILVGASASGKTEVAKLLASKYNIVKVVTHTTRAKRVGETNDVDYHFVSVEEFEKLIKEDQLVEHTFYNGNYYGCSKKEVADNKCALLDVNGVRAFKALNDERVIIILLTAKASTRLTRMLYRGDSLENAQARIKADRTAFSKRRIGETHLEIVTDLKTLEEITDEIYDFYTNKLKKVGTN